MKNKTFESKTDTQPSLSPYQAERAETQETPGFRPDPLGGTLAPPGSEATVRAHAVGLTRATAGRTLRRLQRQYGNRYVQRVVELAQRRGSGEGFQLDDETASCINRARGGGQPLDGAVQAHMSEALDYDFSGVRVHTDSEAHTLNRLLSARAFTTGHDIFFQRGEYNPGSGSGRELIAHELTHVVQQSSGQVSSGGSGMTVRPAGDVFEQEADAFSRQPAPFGQHEHLYDLALQRAVARTDLASPADILALQRTVGNRAVQRLQAQGVAGGMDDMNRSGRHVGEPNESFIERHSRDSTDQVKGSSGWPVRTPYRHGRTVQRSRAADVMHIEEEEYAVVAKDQELGYRNLAAGCIAVTAWFAGGGGMGMHLAMRRPNLPQLRTLYAVTTARDIELVHIAGDHTYGRRSEESWYYHVMDGVAPVIGGVVAGPRSMNELKEEYLIEGNTIDEIGEQLNQVGWYNSEEAAQLWWNAYFGGVPFKIQLAQNTGPWLMSSTGEAVL